MKNNLKVYNTTIQYYENKSEDGYIDIPDDMLSSLGWVEGDNLKWSLTTNGIILTKINSISKEI